MAGLDPVTGILTRRTAEDINQQILDDLVAEISPSLDTSSTSPAGQIASPVAKIAGELWDSLEAVNAAGDPDRATGDGQDALCAISGTSREAASHSQVACQLALGAAVTVPLGSKIAVLGNPTSVFELIGDTVTLGVPVVSTVPGTYVGLFQSVATGPIAANANTLTVIVTPITGWTGVNNPGDATLGHNIETSTDLRIRREVEIAALGSTPVDALRAELDALMAAKGIVGGFADVVDNPLDVADADGRPPHSIEALVDDGVSPLSNDLIAQTIWDGRAGGIQTFGSTNGNAVDTKSTTRVMHFNRPTPINIYFGVSIVIDSAIFPGDGDVQIKVAMVALGAALKPGADVARNAFFGPIFSIPGVANVTVLTLGTAPAPVGTADIVIGVRERARFDTARISVTHV